MRRLLTLMIGIAATVTTPALSRDITIEFDDGRLPEDGTVIVGVYAHSLTPSATDLNQELRGKLVEAIAADRFDGSVGRTLEIVAPASSDYDRVILSGLGDRDAIDATTLQDFAGAAVQHLPIHLESAVIATSGLEVDGMTSADIAAEVALGARLGGYRFDRYFRPEFRYRLDTVVVHSSDADTARSRYRSQNQAIGDGVVFARNLISEPANRIYPESFVERAIAAFDGLSSVEITVLDEEQIRSRGMGALTGVGQGSDRPPRLLIIRHNGGDDGESPIAFVGKGVTFDSGGISLKDKAGMWKMKYDMSGAAAVTGTVLALARRGASVNAIAVAALVENMPSGRAQRPGDVVTTMSGKTIEILSTDAEGRLILADAVWFTQEEYQPAIVVDVATLTGSVRRALGDEYAGLFTHDDLLATQLLASGERAGETLWRLPLHASYATDIASLVADIKNTSGNGLAGAGIGAQVIGTFVKEDTVWAHLDIAGTAWRDTSYPTVPIGAAGYGVRLLNRLVADYYEN